MKLREYQQRAIDELYKWFSSGNKGNPCLVLPTGSGKSHIIAALCKDALQQWPETQVLMLTHVKELIQQNAEKMREHWPNAPMGIYSSSLNKRQLGEPIIFAGIQSIRNRSEQLGHIDLVIIDECFSGDTLISTLSGLKKINQMRCGDIVYNGAGTGIVKAVSVKNHNTIYEMRLSNEKKITTTNNHPIFTGRGWVKVEDMEKGDCVFGLQDMRRMRNKNNANQAKRKNSCKINFSNDSFLLNILLEKERKCNVDGWRKRKNERNIKAYWSQTNSTWRQRQRINRFTEIHGGNTRSGMDNGTSNKNKCRTSEWCLSELLQGRYWEQRIKNSYRIGRGISQRKKKTIRCKKRQFSKITRLESIEIKKSRSPTLMYNLQVSGHPSYFAGGILVHNCHLVSHKDEGGYRKLLSALLIINPALRVIGLTASPYRLNHGMITDKPALFDDLIGPVSIEELIYKGFLSTLRSKRTSSKLDISEVHKRGGEYIDSELQAAVDNDDKNQEVVSEVIRLAGDRKAWLFFCSGVAHAEHIKEVLISQGIVANCITGETNQKERAQIIEDFKSGKIKALTNANVLTTGFDYPDIDLIAMLRPTMSASLYVQMAGRGMRPKSHADHCLVLDFAGVVETHGPITNIKPPLKKKKGEGEAPSKLCPECNEIVYISVNVCPSCGFEFPASEGPDLVLRNDDIMGIEGSDMEVTSWNWRKHTSKASGKEMLAVTYYGALSDAPVTEYLCVLHDGYAGDKARKLFRDIVHNSFGRQSTVMDEWTLDRVASYQQEHGTPPSSIEYTKYGKFFRVMNRSWLMIKEPDYLIEYRQTVKSGPPKCCHTCDFYGKKYNFCSKFGMNPPEAFVNERDACNQYIEVIPF